MSFSPTKKQFSLFMQSIGKQSKVVIDNRKSAFAKFIKMDLPTKKDENWQYTN